MQQQQEHTVLQPGSRLPDDGFGSLLLDRGRDGLGLGQGPLFLRDPQLQQVAPTREDLAAQKLTENAVPMFSRTPTTTTTHLVYKDALVTRTDTDSVLRPYSLRVVGPDQLLVGSYEDFQFHPTIYSRSNDARGGRPPPSGDAAQALSSAWRYPYSEIGTVEAAGLVTSQLNYQENKDLQLELERHARRQGASAMPGATQMHGYVSKGIFGEGAGRVLGTAPAAETQGILSVVPASGAVMMGNDVPGASALQSENEVIQGERILAYDQQLKAAMGFRAADQFTLTN